MKHVLVTGAYGGAGSAVVEALEAQGFFVFALDKRVAQAREHVMPIEADITKEADILRAYETISAVTQELYAVIHLAGIYMLDSLVEIEEQRLTKIFDINVFGAYRVNKILIPLLKKGSKILITTSELAPLDPLPFTGIYAITKSTLDKYAYSLRMELQLLGISVSVLRPGAIKTDMLGASMDALDEFCKKSELYSCNAKRFKKIVNKVEARHITPQRLAKRVLKIVNAKRPRQVYKINRNPLLLMLNVLPRTWQTKIIKSVLK